jgi:hypothetical protein
LVFFLNCLFFKQLKVLLCGVELIIIIKIGQQGKVSV